MKSLMSAVFGAVTAFTITSVSDYYLYDWQWWVAFLAIVISGVLYARIRD